MQVFVEYGIDFDNNRFGVGRSIEVEDDNGNEFRTKQMYKLKNRRYYFRIWIGKIVFSYSKNDGLRIKYKTRNNVKIILGYTGVICH